MKRAGLGVQSALEHRLGRTPFGSAVGLGDHAATGKAIAVLHYHMAYVAHSSLATGRLAIKFGIEIAGRGVVLFLRVRPWKSNLPVVLVATFGLKLLCDSEASMSLLST